MKAMEECRLNEYMLFDILERHALYVLRDLYWERFSGEKLVALAPTVIYKQLIDD